MTNNANFVLNVIVVGWLFGPRVPHRGNGQDARFADLRKYLFQQVGRCRTGLWVGGKGWDRVVKSILDMVFQLLIITDVVQI